MTPRPSLQDDSVVTLEEYVVERRRLAQLDRDREMRALRERERIPTIPPHLQVSIYTRERNTGRAVSLRYPLSRSVE